MDPAEIGKLAAEFMDILEREHPEGELQHVMIIGEVHTDDGGQKSINTPTACTDDSRVYQTGLLSWAQDVVAEGEPMDEDD